MPSSTNYSELEKILQKYLPKQDWAWEQGFVGNTSYVSGELKSAREEIKKLQKEFSNLPENLSETFDIVRKIQRELSSGNLTAEEYNALKKEEIRLTSIIRKYHGDEEAYYNDKLELQGQLRLAKKEEYELEKKISEEEEFQNKKRKEGIKLEEELNHSLQKLCDKWGLNHKKITNGFSEIKGSIEGIKGGFSNIINLTKSFLEPWGRVSQAASNYSKAIGGSAESMAKLRRQTIDFVERNNIGKRFNASAEDLIKMQEQYNSSLGRAVSLTDSQKENMAAMKALYKGNDGDIIKLTTGLENFGLDNDSAGKFVGNIFAESTAKGIAFEKYSKNFVDNLSIAQNYSFSNGLKGLQSMAEKATEIKFNMQQTAQIAEKLSTVEGSVKASAELSVLGGRFASIANPMSMLNESLNDMEGLQDRIIQMITGMGRWDSTKGMIDVSAMNKRLIRQAANAIGANYSDLMTSANAIGRRNEIKTQMKGLGFTDEMQEYIQNVGQLDENGKAYVNINGQKRNLDTITAGDYDEIKKISESNNRSEAEDIKYIAETLRGWNDVMEGTKKQIDNSKANIAEQHNLGTTVMDIADKIADNSYTLAKISAILTQISIAVAAFGVAKSVGGLVNGGMVMGKGFMRGPGGMTVTATNVAGGTTNGGGAVTAYAPGSTYLNGSVARGSVTAGSAAGSGMLTRGNMRQAQYAQLRASGVSAGQARSMVSTTGKFARGLNGASLPAMIAGGLMSASADNDFAKGKATNGSVALKSAGNALSYLGTGAMLGSMFGPWGTLIGAIGGALYGGIAGYSDARDKYLRQEIKNKRHIDIMGEYSNAELEDMLNNGSAALYMNNTLRDKFLNQEGYEDIPHFQNGYLPNGDGGKFVGASHAQNGGIPAFVNGKKAFIAGNESLIGVSATSRYPNTINAIQSHTLPSSIENILPRYEHGKTPIVKPNGNPISSVKVKNKGDGNSASKNRKISFEPLSVNINFNINSNVKDMDVSKLISENDKRRMAKEIEKELMGLIKKTTVNEDRTAFGIM